jgi:threonine dehydrogenase-like Zn-dependent dehydrogenase
VVGAGAIGLFLLDVLAQWGVKTRYVSEHNSDRLAMAVELGAIPIATAGGSLSGALTNETHGSGVTFVFDAVGTHETRLESLLSLSPGGTLVLVGLHTDATELPLNVAIRNELNVVGAFAYTESDFREGLSWLASGRIGLRSGIVVAPLADGQEWYERLIKGDPSSKVLLKPGGAS